MIDLLFSVALFAAASLVAGAYAARATRLGRAPDAGLHPGGGRVGTRALEVSAWALQPLSHALARAGVHPNAISWSSLALGAGAGTAIGFGHFGVGAAMSLASTACDALDGRVARQTGTASHAGAVLDAAIDRYAELFVLGGIALALRTSAVMLMVTLGAMAGAIMVSYANAKAEALRVEPPTGSMRRQEQALYLGLGVGLVPIVAAIGARSGAPVWASRSPLVAILGLIAIVGNASAISRLAAIARAAPSIRHPRESHKRPAGTTEIAPSRPGGSVEMTPKGHATASDAFH